jgi:hypothetical protein
MTETTQGIIITKTKNITTLICGIREHISAMHT